MITVRTAALPTLAVLAALLIATGARAAFRCSDDRNAQQVLLISVDGMHAVDLHNYVAAHPHSALARLSRAGLTYPNASCSRPSDSFPGLLAMVTGGTPRSTGVYYDNSYDRGLLPPADQSNLDHAYDPTKPGTQVVYDETIDLDPTVLDGGGGINPAFLPRDASTGNPVFPHNFVRVNTIFQVIKQAGLRTAWSDKHRAYDLVNGPDSAGLGSPGVDDLYTPEIAANAAVVNGQLVDSTTAPPGTDLESITTRLQLTEAYDSLKVQAVLNEIAGKDHSGTHTTGVPAVFGMNFQSISVAQKLKSEPVFAGDPFSGLTGGYTDAAGTPGPLLSAALDYVDASLGAMVQSLRTRGLLSSTVVIISAKHGQAPIDRSLLIKKKGTVPTTQDPSDQLDPALAPQVTTDDVGLVWLDAPTPAETAKAVTILQANAAADHIQTLLFGPAVRATFGDPAHDSRVPDIFILPQPGVIYTKGSKIAEHGGFSHDDTNVALLVAGAEETGTEREPVQTRQIAPTILRLLGLNPHKLDAVRQEHTRTLPELDG
jgi:hypothetical protein